MDEGAVGHDLQQLVGLIADGVGSEVPVVDHPGRDDGCVLVVTAATEVGTIIVTQSSHIALRFCQREGQGGNKFSVLDPLPTARLLHSRHLSRCEHPVMQRV